MSVASARPGCGQVPVHVGARFSANARGPSLASSDTNTSRITGACMSQNAASVRPLVSRSTFLEAATDSGALRAIRSANCSAASSAPPFSDNRDTRPVARACWAVMGSAVRAISMATP